MISLDEMEALLDEIATGFPQEIFKELNGGIILLPEEKRNSCGSNLYILGEYHSGGNMGRFIVIYYGSFMRLYGNYPKVALRNELEHTLKHEFTHHLESLAGQRDLEVKDAQFLAEYFGHD